jgi:hypothetical protein
MVRFQGTVIEEPGLNLKLEYYTRWVADWRMAMPPNPNQNKYALHVPSQPFETFNVPNSTYTVKVKLISRIRLVARLFFHNPDINMFTPETLGEYLSTFFAGQAVGPPFPQTPKHPIVIQSPVTRLAEMEI